MNNILQKAKTVKRKNKLIDTIRADNEIDRVPEKATFEAKAKKAWVRKNRTIILAKTYEKTNITDRERISLKLRLCGTVLKFGENTKTGEAKLIQGMFCQKRLCPMCSWRRANRTFKNIEKIIAEPEFKNAQFIFITLTVRNCESKNLADTLDRLFDAWRNLTKNANQPFRKSFLGTFRALEITYHDRELTPEGEIDQWYDTYHPHFHVLAACSKEYFKKDSPLYITGEKLTEIWQNALNRTKRKDGSKWEAIDYEPSVDIEKVKEKNGKASADKKSDKNKKDAIAETAKYTVKAEDYIDRSNVVETLEPALKGRRLVAYGGLLKEIRKRLRLPNEDEAGIDESESENHKDWIYRLMTWQFGAHTYKIEVVDEKKAKDAEILPYTRRATGLKEKHWERLEAVAGRNISPEEHEKIEYPREKSELAEFKKRMKTDKERADENAKKLVDELLKDD